MDHDTRLRFATAFLLLGAGCMVEACGGEEPSQPPIDTPQGGSNEGGAGPSTGGGGAPVDPPPACPGTSPATHADTSTLVTAPLDLEAWEARSGDSPGGTASLELAKESGVDGMRLSYDHCNDQEQCAAYAIATWASEETEAGGIAFRARTRDHGTLFVRVVDGEGQTFQYSPFRSLESDEDELSDYRIVFADTTREPGFPYATTHYGGANDGVFRGGVTRIGIGTGTFFGKDIAGDLFFTDVRIVGAETYPVTVGVDVAGGDFGYSAGRRPGATFGIATSTRIDRRERQAQFAELKSLGFDYIRTDAPWSSVETNEGEYKTDVFVDIRDDAAAAGLEVYFILDYNNTLYAESTKHGVVTDANRAAYVDYATAFVDVTKASGVHYEIWNEPNGNGFWAPQANPVEYGPLCKATVEAIKPLLVDGQTVAGGVLANGSLSFGFQRSFEANGGCLADTTAGVPTMFAYHPYRSTAETWGQVLNQWRTQLPGIEIINTEWGVAATHPFNGQTGVQVDGNSPEGRRRQAVEVARRFLVDAGLAPLRSTYYRYRDIGSDGSNREHNYALFDVEGVIKDSGVAARQVLSYVKEWTFAGWRSAADGRVHAARFAQDDRTALVLWTEARSTDVRRTPSFRAEVRCEGLSTAVDMIGGPVTIEQDNGTCSVLLTEDAGPVFLTYEGCSVTGE